MPTATPNPSFRILFSAGQVQCGQMHCRLPYGAPPVHLKADMEGALSSRGEKVGRGEGHAPTVTALCDAEGSPHPEALIQKHTPPWNLGCRSKSPPFPVERGGAFPTLLRFLLAALIGSPIS